MKIKLTHKFNEIISIDNILDAWKEFVKGKRNKKDVAEFEFRLMDNILSLHNDLKNHIYAHGGYEQFNISDPKPRRISKASVRDRLVHHMLYRVLYPFFDRIFIADSYSCREDKGTFKAINKFRSYFYKVSKNDTRTCWVLKCDIKKFFDNINHDILTAILSSYIPDKNILLLCQEIIGSFYSTIPNAGLPLGNLTSQLFVNIYMNEFDQFIKHKIKAKYYIRYADDFIILSDNHAWLESILPVIRNFLGERLKLQLHPDKVSIRAISSGIDFLGWVNFPDHRVLRTSTKRRMIKRVVEHSMPETINSYVALLNHGNAKKLKSILFREGRF